MISRLWLTLTHFFDYKTDINVKFQSSGPGPFIFVVHRSSLVRGPEDAFLSDVLIPLLLSLNVSFEVIGLPALFSNPRYKILDWAESFFMILGLERWRPSYWEVTSKVKRKPSTHVIFNGAMPTFSLALPEALHRRGLKTFLWVHDARLQCANGVNFNGHEECHRCLTQGSRWAFLQNCFPGWGRRIVYSFIYRGRRVPQLIASGIDRFIAFSDFSAKNIQSALDIVGGTGCDVAVIRHPREPATPHSLTKHRPATVAVVALTKKIPSPFFAFAGPLSFEKGADRVLELARKLPDRGFLLCGEGPLLEKLRALAPGNAVFAGLVEKEERDWIFQNAAAVLIPSRIPETSSPVITESDAFGTPVIFPAGSGGLTETVKELGRSGCPWDEFTGQIFPRTESLRQDENACATALKKVLGIDRE